MSVVRALEHPAPRARRRRDHRVNLSSNELSHPALDDVLRELLDGFDPATLRGYPEQETAVAAAAELVGAASVEEVVLGAGSDGILRLLQTELHADFDGRLVLQTPNYEAWTTSRTIAGWSVTAVPTPPGATLADRLGPALDAPPSLVVVSWPNGPAGYVPPLAEVEALVDVCATRGHLLVLDGCYSAFVSPESPWRLARLAGPSCLVLLSWSKMFGIAGGRLAVATGDRALTRRLRLHRQEDHVNAYALHALRRTAGLLAAYRPIWLDIAAERDRVRALLRERHGLAVPESGGNFLHLPMRDAAEARELTAALDRAGYRVRDMLDTAGLAHHVRFTVTGDTSGFLDTLDQLLSQGVRAA